MRVKVFHPEKKVDGKTFISTCNNRHNWRTYKENPYKRVSVCDKCSSTLTEYPV